MKIVRELLTNPISPIKKARKKKNLIEVMNVLVLSSIITALSIGIVVLKLYSSPLTGLELYISAAVAAVVFMIVFFMLSLFGFIIKIIAVNLGGRGKYLEGLTCIAYASIAPSIGILISSLMLYVPFNIIISAVIVAVTTALGLSTLYRSVKELFRMDMITTLVTVFMTMLSVIYIVVLLNGLTKIATLSAAI